MPQRSGMPTKNQRKGSRIPRRRSAGRPADFEALRSAPRSRGSRRCGAAFVAGLLLIVASLGCGERDAEPEQPPSIILIVVDTLRRDALSPYGSAVPTHNIARFALGGQVWPNAYASFHQTTMSMGAMFTGLTPSIESQDPAQPLTMMRRNWCGLRRFAGPSDGNSCIPEAVPTLTESLRRHGYWTAGVVANHLLFAPDGFERGFDRWIEVETSKRRGRRAKREERPRQGPTSASIVNRHALELLDERPESPFFLYLHYIDVHDYYFVAADYYRRAVEIFDRDFGGLLEALEEHGALENTLLVFTSDHGHGLNEPHPVIGKGGHYGNPTYDTVLRVPLIVSGAREIDTDRFIRTQDIPALVHELLGLDTSPRDEVLEDDELLLTEARYHTYRRGRWKSIWPRDGEKALLFDLEADPAERTSVASEHPDVLDVHRRRIDALRLRLAARPAAPDSVDARDARRLRVLGYLD